MSYKKKKLKKSKFGQLRFRFGLAKVALWKFARKVVKKLQERRIPVFDLEKAIRTINRYDRLSNNPDSSKLADTIVGQLNESGFLRLCVFACPKFNTKALFTRNPESYMPVEAGPDLFEPRIQKIRELRQNLMKAGLPTEINVIIGDNDAEEYIFQFVDFLSLNPNLYRQRQTLYRQSFEQRCKREFGDRVTVWSLAESGVSQDIVEPTVSADAVQKELDFFGWLFSKDGPYRGILNFPKEVLTEMAKRKYKLYGSQGKFLEILGGVLLQTEGPGVWLERTNMLRCTGSPAVPAIYPWIRKDEVVVK